MPPRSPKPEGRPAGFAAIVDIGRLAAIPVTSAFKWGVAGRERLTKIDYSAVQTLLAIENPIVRKGLHEAFRHEGFGKCVESFSQESFHQAISEASFDLIIMAAEIGGFFIAQTIAEMRNGKLTHHSFPIVMMLLAAGEGDYVRKVIDCGPDDMLLMPVAPGPVLRRIGSFAIHRKPFVVTQDYTGPDRRKQPRPGREKVALIEVPNPLQARIAKLPANRLKDDMETAAVGLNLLKLERYAVQFCWLADTIETMFRHNEADPARLAAFALRMKQIVEDLPPRLQGEVTARISGLLSALDAGAGAILHDGAAVDRRHLEQTVNSCRSLAEEIRAALRSRAAAPAGAGPA